jgi:hypothetical protein
MHKYVKIYFRLNKIKGLTAEILQLEKVEL